MVFCTCRAGHHRLGHLSLLSLRSGCALSAAVKLHPCQGKWALQRQLKLLWLDGSCCSCVRVLGRSGTTVVIGGSATPMEALVASAEEHPGDILRVPAIAKHAISPVSQWWILTAHRFHSARMDTRRTLRSRFTVGCVRSDTLWIRWKLQSMRELQDGYLRLRDGGRQLLRAVLCHRG